MNDSLIVYEVRNEFSSSPLPLDQTTWSKFDCLIEFEFKNSYTIAYFVDSSSLIVYNPNLKLRDSVDFITIPFKQVMRDQYFEPIEVYMYQNFETYYTEGLEFKDIITYQVYDERQDYLTQIGSCINYEKLSESIPKVITVNVPYGKYAKLIEFDDDIERVYKSPFGLKINGNALEGRLLISTPREILIKLVNGKFYKVLLKPYIAETYK